MPSLDPLHIRKLNLIQGAGHRVNIELFFNEIDMTGLSKAVAYKASGFNENPSDVIDIRFTTPKLVINGPYKVKGQISFLPLNGNGQSELSLGIKTARTTLNLNNLSN